MRSLGSRLTEKLKDEPFRRLYEEEKQLAELSVRILRAREQVGLSQHEVAKRAKVTQQQLSKIENGVNCSMFTFLKVCNALDQKVDLVSSTEERFVR